MVRAIRRAIFRVARQQDERNRFRPDPVLVQEAEDLRAAVAYIRKAEAKGVQP